MYYLKQTKTYQLTYHKKKSSSLPNESSLPLNVIKICPVSTSKIRIFAFANATTILLGSFGQKSSEVGATKKKHTKKLKTTTTLDTIYTLPRSFLDSLDTPSNVNDPFKKLPVDSVSQILIVPSAEADANK